VDILKIVAIIVSSLCGLTIKENDTRVG